MTASIQTCNVCVSSMQKCVNSSLSGPSNTGGQGLRGYFGAKLETPMGEQGAGNTEVET